jgi:hypothetical protein
VAAGQETSGTTTVDAMEPISPELALVDPELARQARALLRAPASLDLPPRNIELVAPPTPEHRSIHRDRLVRVAALLAIPSIALNIALLRTDSGRESAAPAPPANSNASPRPATTPGLGARTKRPARATGRQAEGVEAAQYELNRNRAAAVVARRVVRWPATAKAVSYDVVVWRGRRRIADVWSTKPEIQVRALACHGTRRLAPGRYLWFVYPLLDSQPRSYGRLSKWGRFSVAAGGRCS